MVSLAKWLSVRLRTKWLWVRVQLQSLIPVVTLSTQDNAELVQQLKPNFKREIRWNKYQSEIERQAQNPYLDYLIDPCFQGVNRIFVFSSEDVAERTNHWNYFLPTVIINIYKIMIYGRNLFD